MNKLFENTLYINLDSRPDRNESALKEFAKMGITPQRVSAVDTTDLFPKDEPGSPGMLGCGLSHLKCLKMARDNNWDYVFICEDDVGFTNPGILKSSLQKFLNNPKSPDWDVLLMGCNLFKSNPRNKKLNNYSIRVRKGLSTVSYIVKKRYYDTFIQNLEESTEALKQNLTKDLTYALDVAWLQLQKQDTFIMIIPATVIQNKSYSDISKSEVDHSSSLLNTRKGL